MASGKCGKNLTWTLYNTGTLTIRGKGSMEDYSYYGETPWDSFSYLIEKVIIRDGVTSIGEYAFEYCSNLEKVTISNSVRKIGDSAFGSCGITEIKIPDSVKQIEDWAFNSCSYLKEVKLPKSITSIGFAVFNGCTRLEKIYYPKKLRSFEEDLSYGNNAELIPYTKTPPATKRTSSTLYWKPSQPVVMPMPQPVVAEKLHWEVEGKTLTVGGVREIKYYPYADIPWIDNLNKIQKIVIEDGVEKVAANAFIECTRLEQLIIPASVKTIGDYAFAICYCGERTVNNGKNVIWSLDDGVLMIKKNPAARCETNFATGFETWEATDKNIKGVKIERGVIPSKQFFDWLARMGNNLQVSF